MSVAYGGSARQAGLDGHIIQPKKLRDIAGKELQQPLLPEVKMVEGALVPHS